MADSVEEGHDIGVEYIEFPSRIVGGAAGFYEIECDVESGMWAEYLIVAISNGAVAGQAAGIINGNSRESLKSFTSGLNYVGGAGTALNKDNGVKGMAFTMVASTSIFAPMTYWERITNSERRVFMRLDPQASSSMYVSIRFRIAVLKAVPELPVTVHHEQPEILNAARADAVRQRLALQKEIDQGEGLSAGEHQKPPHMRAGMQSFLLKGQK